jgi:hypothetical protein
MKGNTMENNVNKEAVDYFLQQAIGSGFTSQEEVDSMTDEEKVKKANEFKNFRPV